MEKPHIIRFDANVALQRWPDYPEDEIASGSRACKGHFYLEDVKQGLSAGVWEADANETHWMDYPVHEFIIIIAGEVTIAEEGRSTTFRTGDCFLIPKGLHCRWLQPGKVRKYFVILDDATEAAVSSARHVLKIDPRTELLPSEPPSPAVLLTAPPPQQKSLDVFAALAGRFTVGVWETSAYARRLIDFPRHELMHLVEGRVTLTDDQGTAQTFSAGDTFFVPLGTPNAWVCEGTLRKIYCILMPPET